MSGESLRTKGSLQASSSARRFGAMVMLSHPAGECRSEQHQRCRTPLARLDPAKNTSFTCERPDLANVPERSGHDDCFEAVRLVVAVDLIH